MTSKMNWVEINLLTNLYITDFNIDYKATIESVSSHINGKNSHCHNSIYQKIVVLSTLKR